MANKLLTIGEKGMATLKRAQSSGKLFSDPEVQYFKWEHFPSYRKSAIESSFNVQYLTEL